MKRNTPRDGGRRLAREALRLAPGRAEPDLSRLRDALPDLLAEARRRRAAAAPELPVPLAARAWRAIPKLATVTAAAVVLASIAWLVDRGSSTTGTASVDSLILGTDYETPGDSLIDAVLATERHRG